MRPAGKGRWTNDRLTRHGLGGEAGTMPARLALALAPIAVALALAPSAFAITTTPSTQSHQYGSEKAVVSVGDVSAGTSVLRRLVRANGVVVNTWQTGPGDYTWGGKTFGTDTLTVCVDETQDGTCEGPAVTATATWTQYPAIVSYKNATSNVDRATFSNGVTAQFRMNVVCDPGGPFYPRQGFFFIDWADSAGPHRFVMDYMSSAACTANAFGGYDQTVFGWGRLSTGEAHPFKIILSVGASGPPLELRFGVGNAPPGLDWDFLDGTLLKGRLLVVPGA